MLLGSANLLGYPAAARPLLLKAADALAAEDVAAHEADHGIGHVLARSRAAAAGALVDQMVVVHGQANELKDARVADHG